MQSKYIMFMAGILICGSLSTGKAWGYEEVVLQTIAMESADQPALGQQRVAEVIINRAKLSGESLMAVCLKPKQFSAWNDRKWAVSWLSRHYDTRTRDNAIHALEMAENAQNRPLIDHYHRFDVHPSWAKRLKKVEGVGAHVFYSSKGR